MFLSGGGTATARLDQQLRHPLNCLVIFDVLGKSRVRAGFATRVSASLAQRVSDVRDHDETAFRDFRCGRSKR
jgi:hypothetical protein